MDFPNYTAAERITDSIVHIVGLLFGVAASALLILYLIERFDPVHATGHGVYMAGILVMLVCSALYNLAPQGPAKALFRRLDHAAIFLAIAGTYTPFALLAIGGSVGTKILIFVWSVAALGVVFKLIWAPRFEALSIAIYVLLGWTILLALEPLLAAMSGAGVTLLLAGGLLYSAGIIFYLWESLPFQNAIWHMFVLAAVFCHFLVVITDPALWPR